MAVGDATKGWIHFGINASSVVAIGGGAAAGIIPFWGVVVGAVITGSAHAVTDYLLRKQRELG